MNLAVVSTRSLGNRGRKSLEIKASTARVFVALRDIGGICRKISRRFDKSVDLIVLSRCSATRKSGRKHFRRPLSACGENAPRRMYKTLSIVRNDLCGAEELLSEQIRLISARNPSFSPKFCVDVTWDFSRRLLSSSVYALGWMHVTRRLDLLKSYNKFASGELTVLSCRSLLFFVMFF